jgi:trk system potassium uptake protein
MNYIVVGCGRVGAELAYSLYRKGHKVSVIDHIASAFNNLHPDFRGRMIEGEALNKDVLHRAGIETADGLACVTNSDTLNAVVAHIARSAYHVTRIVIRNYDPAWRRFHDAFEFHTVSSSTWGAQRIEEMLDHPEMHTVYSAGNGEVEIYEFNIPNHWDGHKLGEILPSENCSPVSITHAGTANLLDCDTIIQKDDIILVSATNEGIQKLRQKLYQQPEG